MLPPRLIRRLVLAPLVIVIAFGFIVLSPFLALAALVSGLLARPRAGRMRSLRLLGFALVWLVAETVALIALAGLWVVSGFGGRLRTEPYQSRHYAVMRWFLDTMYRGAERTYGLRVEVDEPELTGDELAARLRRPVIVLSRHAGPGDSFLLVHQLLSVYHRRPRVVMKAALQLDPSVDVVGNRLPNVWIKSRQAGEHIFTEQIARLARGLDERGALVIFPEGGNWTPGRWRRGIRRLEHVGRPDLAERARDMPNLLPPRPGGALAAIAACPDADVIFVAHAGLDNIITVADVWSKFPVDQVIRARWWRVPDDSVPRSAGHEVQVQWLYDWWERIDGWITENRPGGVARPAAAPLAGDETAGPFGELPDAAHGHPRSLRSTVADMEPARTGEAPADDGRIPFTLRIGVTGHRDLANPDALREPIRAALGRLRNLVPVAPGAGLALVAVSPLAEGADRLVAEEILAEKDARLEVALPLPADDYADDFKTEGSRQEFCSLLGRACEVWEAPFALSREEAYERAGRYVVDRCDALIALWDGEPSRGRGGTADIVGYAQEQGVPIAWVHTTGEPVVDYALENSRAEVVTAAARKLRKYNTGRIARSKFEVHARRLRADVMPDMTRNIPIDPLGLSREAVAGWVFPYFIRADILALRYQRVFRWLSLAVFALAAIAVGVVAVQATFWAGQNWGPFFEALSLLALLIILAMNQRVRLHDRWISSRFLAERLRSSYFLALAGTGDRRPRSARLAYLSDSSEAWIERALTEVSARRPELDDGPPPVTALRDYLNRYWIESQISYQRKTSQQQRTYDKWLVWATISLFSLTLVAAIIHIAGSHLHLTETTDKVLVAVSITVPAIGAAFHGFGAQRQFRHHAERYRTMAGVLTQVEAEMREATTLEQVREVAAETERVMREENSDWFGVMRFHDMELIT